MGTTWRTAVGAISGVVAAVIWGVSLAVYQPFMEPDGFYTDPRTGETYPELGSNNTYWPRDVRQLAIFLAFVGVVLICRANLRGIIAGAVGAAVWIGVDLALDRIDVSGDATAVWLSVGGTVAFAGMAFAARKVSTGSEISGHFLATVVAVSAAGTILITTPWDEPVTNPDRVQVENVLTLFKVGLVVMLAAVAAGLLPLDRIRWMAPFAGLAALAAWPATATYGWLGALGLVVLPAAAATTVAAARDVSLRRLLAVMTACAVALIPVYLLLYLAGSGVGDAMTFLAGKPAINSADEDFSLSFAALVLGLLFAWISHTLTRPAPAPALVPVGLPE